MRQLLVFLALLICGPALAQSARNIRLLCNWRDTTHAPGNGSGQHWNDVWGFSANGREYGVIGGTNGLHIIDVNTCQEKVFYPGRTGNVVHRDYKTYRNYLYAVCDEGYASLQIFDLKYLPDSVHKVFDDGEQLCRAHTIFIDTEKAVLYAAGASDRLGLKSNLQIYSLADPEKPAYIGATKDVVYTHAVYARNDTIWSSDAFEGLHIITAKQPPLTNIFGGLVSYPDKGYNHSSWIGYDGIGVMADETFGRRVKVIDASDPGDVKVLSMFAPRGTDTLSIAHNPYLLGRSAIVSYYMDGLQIYDISDPLNPVQTGYFNTYAGPAVQTFAGAWGAYPFLPSRRILVSDMQNGLYVLDATAALGVSAPGHPGMSVYPNPVTGGRPLRATLPESWAGPLNLQLRDITGRVLHSAEYLYGGNTPLEVSLPRDWPEGVYLLQVSGPAGLLSHRVIKR